MSKVIDAFLFFQELDLLDIRLAYLNPYVDRFVIVEACQTFSGKPKGFVFEEHAQRFAKYLHKIEYQKITDFHRDFQSVQQHLKDIGTPSHQKILSIMEQHNHYPKTELHWVLDTYHRECIHLALDRIADDEDIVIISDLDEIPCVQLFTPVNLTAVRERPRVCQQREFRYFLNYYKDADWLGTIAGRYWVIGKKSLNLLRIDSKATRKIVDPAPIMDCGYHFTSCGGIEMIREKIKSWGHQEFNNSVVINNIEKNILSGQDIFQRETGTNLKRVDIMDRQYFDSAMSSLLVQYPHLISGDQIDVIESSLFRDLWRRTVMTWQKVQYKLERRLKIKNNI
jgi:beta-1,4-mannosyl-glycoprotein beta-1,4-N-acetylglucosaminyltransferase